MHNILRARFRSTVSRSNEARNARTQHRNQMHSMAAVIINDQKIHAMLSREWLITFLICLYFIFICIYMYIYVYICIYMYVQLQINIWKPSRCLKSIPRQVFCINFSRRIQILLFLSHEKLFISLFYYFHSYLHLFICLFMHLYTFISTF